MNLLAMGSVLVGAFFWVATVKSFFEEPGYGGFDMTAASAFDLGWAKGAIFLAVGVGIFTHSLPVGSIVGVGGFLASMLIKPVLEKVVASRMAKLPVARGDDPPPTGFAALGQVERDAAARESADE